MADLDQLSEEKLIAAIELLDGATIPKGVRRAAMTWPQAQQLGMTPERWEEGEEIAPGLRLFEGYVE